MYFDGKVTNLHGDERCFNPFANMTPGRDKEKAAIFYPYIHACI